MVDINLICKLNPPYARVVQKANIGHSYTYALQMYKDNTYVSRTRNATYDGQTLNFGSPGLKLTGRTSTQIAKGQNKNAAGGHTQTWEYAGPTGQSEWFIGAKANDDKWTTQIARVPYPSEYTKNTEMVRISNLVEISNQDDWHGQHIYRVEAAVSPDYQYLMLATVWTNQSGHFALYNLPEVNQLLNNSGTKNITVGELNSYKIGSTIDISNFVGKIGSIQGYDIDNQRNIYISSQYAPGHVNSQVRKIVKFNWTNYDSWQTIDLTNDSRLNVNFNGYPTEFEGIQVRGVNDLYLTVAYHSVDGNSTIGNQVFRVHW